jgi:hypothetical protein
MPRRAPKPPRQPEYLTRAEANSLDSELSRRGTKILEGRVRENVADAMRVAHIRPALIYAYARTGLLVTETTRSGYSGEQLQAWEAALRTYGKAP